MDSNVKILEKGKRYDAQTRQALLFWGWLQHGAPIYHGSSDGYNVDDYFDKDGNYLGPDEFFIEPAFFKTEIPEKKQ